MRLASGDAVVLGGKARLAFHGVDRIIPGTSTLLPEGGRINLTLRRVTAPMPGNIGPTTRKDVRRLLIAATAR
jgi:alkylated DNA repair protein (DNA oxidative demethylase)